MAGSLVLSGLAAKRAELAARLADLESQAVPIRADIFHLDAALAILRGREVPRMRVQHRPEWFANLGRLILDILRGAREPMTARAIAVEVLRLAGRDVGDRVAMEIVIHRVRASLTRRVGIVERVAVGQRRKGWQVVPARV
jgi:hypothetical protein